MATYTIIDPPAYILDQLLGYATINNLFSNDKQIRDSFATEHVFGTGVHNTPKVAKAEGLITYTTSYALTRGTNVIGADTSGLITGQCRVNFSVTFATLDFEVFPSIQSSTSAKIGYQYDGVSLNSVIVNMVDNVNAAVDATFGITVFGQTA